MTWREAPGRPGRPWVVPVLLAAALPGSLIAQVPPDSVRPDSVAAPEPEPPSTGGWAAYGVDSHPWSTVAALTVVLPVGAAEDAEGRGGTAWLLGQNDRDEIQRRLEDAARVQVEVERSRTVYQVLTPPDGWEQAYEILEDVLFGGSPNPGELDEERRGLLALMAFEAGAPVREFELEMYRMLAGASSPWSRDPRGTPPSLTEITPADLTAYRSEHYHRADAVLSVTGAVDPASVVRAVTGGSASDPSDLPVVAAVAAGSPLMGSAWTEPERSRLVRDVTSGWIAAAYPIAQGTPRTAVEFITQRARSELVTQPPAPGLFSLEIDLVELPSGLNAILIHAAVQPEALGQWEGRIRDTMGRVTGEVLEPGFLRFHRRRFRNIRLVEDAAPEVEGLRSALDLLRDGRIRDLPAEIWGLDSASVREAATGVGPPRMLVFGPDLADGARGP